MRYLMVAERVPYTTCVSSAIYRDASPEPLSMFD